MRVAFVVVFAFQCIVSISAVPAEDDAGVRSADEVPKPGSTDFLSTVTDFTNLRKTLEKIIAEANVENKLEWTLLEVLHAKQLEIVGYRYIGQTYFSDAGEKKKCDFDIYERTHDGYIKGVLSCAPYVKEYLVDKVPVSTA